MNSLTNIVLLVAQSCNLRCRYCYADGGGYGMQPQNMTAATVTRALERLLPMAAGPRLTLSFFGGEPLLNLPLLQKAAALAPRLGDQAGIEIRFALTTNGTLLEGKALEFTRRYVDSLAVSLDGNAAVTDDARRFRLGKESVYARVRIGLARLRAAGVPFSLRATITPENVPFLAASAQHLSQLGAVSLRMVPNFENTIWTEAALADLISGFEIIHRKALHLAMQGDVPLGGETIYPLLKNRLHGVVRNRPCMAGEHMLAVAANGTLYPCDHFVGRPEYAMGNVHDTEFPGPAFAQVRQRLAANTTTARPVCRDCAVNAICGGECPAVTTKSTADATSPGANFCHFKRETVNRLQRLLDQISPSGEPPAALRQLLETET